MTAPAASRISDGVTSAGKRVPSLRMNVSGKVCGPPLMVAAKAASMAARSSGGQ